MDSEDKIYGQYERGLTFPVLNTEEQFLEALRDLSNTYGYIVTGYAIKSEEDEHMFIDKYMLEDGEHLTVLFKDFN